MAISTQVKKNANQPNSHGDAFARYQLGIEPMASAGVDELVAWVGPTVQHYLTGPTPLGSGG
jgi:hypothetical protein